MKIYHLTLKKQWEDSQDDKFYAPPSLDGEGFIHCSADDQVIASANRFYAGKTDLLLLVINVDKVGAKVVFEDLHGRGVAHPHIYGKLPLEAVEKVLQLKPNRDGQFTELPNEAH